MALTQQQVLNVAGTANRLGGFANAMQWGDMFAALCGDGFSGVACESPVPSANASVLAAGLVAPGSTPRVLVLAATGVKGVYKNVVGAPAAGQVQLPVADQKTFTFNAGDAVTAVAIFYVAASGGALAVVSPLGVALAALLTAGG